MFPTLIDDNSNNVQTTAVCESERRRSSLFCDHLHAGDSGIDSIQASPSPNALSCLPGVGPPIITSPIHSPAGSPTPSLTSNRMRRPSSALLHPDHARLLALRTQQISPDQSSIEDLAEFGCSSSGQATATGSGLHRHSGGTASSSTTSSLTSVAGASIQQQRYYTHIFDSPRNRNTLTSNCFPFPRRISDPWLQPERDRDHINRRRSSTMTTRYSLFDALDLEYALLRAAARGSVGPYSLSESLHKLTFTQSLAFPALARGLASKRRRSATQSSARPLNPHESGLNTCAKAITAVVLVAVSFLVFLIVYKFVRT